MAHSYHHAVSSARKWGGVPSDYQAIHDYFDGSKEIIADFRHRALRHHAEGIFMAQKLFGITVTNSDGRAVPRHSTWPASGVSPGRRRVRPRAWTGLAMGRLSSTCGSESAPPGLIATTGSRNTSPATP
jgi:hypothetical protein